MYKFLNVVCFVMAALCAITSGLSGITGHGWEVMTGWAVWAALFYRSGTYFYHLTPKHQRG